MKGKCKMKKALMLVQVLLLVIFFAATVVAVESAKITWKQPAASLPYVQEWVLFVGDTANPTTEQARIPYDGSGAASYTTSIPITVTGTPGAKVKKYFSLASVSKNGNMTAKVAGMTAVSEGLDYLEFTVPYPDVAVPFEVIIQIIGTP
jgi:hypothetical protein